MPVEMNLGEPEDVRRAQRVGVAVQPARSVDQG